MATEPKTLAERSLHSIKWNYLGTTARILAQFVAQILFARLLGPEVLGNFGYVLLLGGLLGLIIDQGLGWALVHSTAVSSRDICVVFYRVMLCATGCAIGSYAFAEQIAALMGAPTAAVAIKYSAPGYLFIGFSVIAQAKLRKAMRFREIQIANVVSYFLAYPLIGVGLAFFGLEIYSLIGAWLLQAAISALILYWYSPFSWQFANPFARLSFGNFGRDILLINATNWVVDNTGGALIARYFGPSALGLYNTTLGLVRIPANHLVGNLQTVLFPAAALVKNDTEQLGKLYRTAFASVVFFALPAFGFVAVSANEIVQLLLGQKWLSAGTLLTPIALAMIPHTLSCLSGSILSGRGDQKIELISQSAVMLLVLGTFLSGEVRTVEQLCWALLGIYSVRACFLFAVASTRFGLGFGWVACAIRGPLVLAFIWIVVYQWLFSNANALLVVVGGGLIVIAIAVALVVLVPRFFLDRSLIALIGKIGSRLPILGRIVGVKEKNDGR